MHSRFASATAIAALAAVVLAGCSKEDDTTSEGDHDASAVPAGVTKQYDVLGDELAEKGQTVESGEWTVNLITEAAEPWHTVHSGGHTAYRDPAKGETNH
ncbi:hypothetical protein, partial [Nocardioides sp. GCM10030258]|uniref:hypothetical protein n=1 Tax=unclassified Nocardioides TaxID=2615069 RepID=UPI003615753D